MVFFIIIIAIELLWVITILKAILDLLEKKGNKDDSKNQIRVEQKI